MNIKTALSTMDLKDIDFVRLTKLTSQQIDHITCLECCKSYIAPATAACGHTLCHTCWYGRRTCPSCTQPLERRNLRYNHPIQNLTEHIHTLGETFEKLFKIKLDDFILNTDNEVSENDLTKNVKDWLMNSQNIFSGPAQSSEQSSQEIQQHPNPLNVSCNKIQIHTHTTKTKSPEKVVHVSVPQDDWDKIEPMPDTEDVKKGKENIVGPMDIEAFYVDDNEYTVSNPRRSSRKRDLKPTEVNNKTNETNSLDKQSLKNSSGEIDKKYNKTKQNEKNIKIMRKEFSKLGKKNQAKSNISQETNVETINPSKLKETNASYAKENAVKIPFYKRSAMYPNCIETNTIKTINHNIDSNTVANDDIEITIKVGNTVTNIFVKKKNDLKLKINTNREIQTSLGPHDINEKGVSLQNTNTQNIVINVGDDHKVDLERQSKTIPKILSAKSIPGKKNTDSADTVTAQFEITESVEKELSKVMEHAEIDEPTKSKNTSMNKEKSSVCDKPQQKTTNCDDYEFINDFDMFESEPIKESDVQILKNSEHAPSEILLCSVKNRNKTQKHTEKRERDKCDENSLPKSKKVKLNDKKNVTANEVIDPYKSKLNPTESDPMNYDAIMDNVFANIDADIEEFRQSQHNDKKTNNLNDDKELEHESHKESHNLKAKRTQEVAMPGKNTINNSKQSLKEYCNQKDSENVFSVSVEKMDVAPTNEKVPLIVPSTNIEEFLTPVMCRNLESTGEALIAENSVQLVDDDDSDKSVVEETPQKSTSLSKTKHKSNGSSKNENQTHKIKLTEHKELSNIRSLESANPKSIISLTDTSTEMRSVNDVTAIEVIDKKVLETPITINKFFNDIQYKSTPYARKSLNFNSQRIDDPDLEQTLCPTNIPIAKTTQEKEFLDKAFEKTPQVVRPLATKNQELKSKRYRIAGSCLTVAEIAKLKLLCAKHKWIYKDKYSKDLTHLVVGVDDENKSKRSVKYMCALASSKWIISYQWVEQCLKLNDVVSEEYFVALDSTGEPGPMRSRIATKKLFQGITFFCMEPFSVLDVETLKDILEAAGGRVVKEAKDVKVTDSTYAPALLLAEPKNTQEDQFIYLAFESSIVPVNYEWVLNCLGSYTLGSIQELLLCPSSMLPKSTEKWPPELLAREED